MALEWSETLVFFSNNALAGSDRRSVRTGAGRCQRQDLAPGRHAGSSSCGMSGCLQRRDLSFKASLDDLPKVIVKTLLIFSIIR